MSQPTAELFAAIGVTVTIAGVLWIMLADDWRQRRRTRK